MFVSTTAASEQMVNNQNSAESTTSTNEIPITGQLLFEDNFSIFNTSLWKRDIKIPLSPVGI